jgi:hypothetical protein
MMQSTGKTGKAYPSYSSSLYMIESRVVMSLNENVYLLNDGRSAQQALSCLIRPEVGDHVLATCGQMDTPYILHILQRSHLQKAQLSVPGAQQLCIAQNQVSVTATDSISINALVDVEMTAATGVLRLNAQNLFTSVTDSLVQNVGHFVGQAEHYFVEVKQLLRLHSKQALITAEQDVKVDAERISMG